MKNLIKAVLIAAALVGSSREARADDGVVVPASKLAAAARASLTQDIAKARKATPEAFQAVDKVASRLAELDASKRGRLAPVTPLLKRLGAKALLPMIERAAIQSPPRGDLTDSAWKAWRVSLIEATGMIRDKRALPVFVAILQGDEADFEVLKVTSESIGRVGDEAAMQQLVAQVKQQGPRQKGLLAGLGESRRLFAAQALADAAKGSSGALDEEGVKLVARSLGQVGSAWAWKLVDSHKDEEASVRALAARALLDIFLAQADDVRDAAAGGILMVDDPSTPQLIAQARKGASAAQLAALDVLERRFAKNPLR